MVENQDKDYSLDSLLQAPPKTSTQIISEDEATKLAKKDMQERSIEDENKIKEIKQNIDLRDSQLATLYGSNAQKNMAEFSDSILDEVKSRDADEVGDMLTELMVQVKNSNPEDQQNFIERIFNNGKNKVERYLASYQSLSANIDQITTKLLNEQKDLLKQVTVFDQLYESNLKQYKELELYILAGEEKIQEMRETALPKLYAEAKASTNPMALQVVSDLEANVNRFERKIHELKISQTLSLQTAPQIKLMQNNDQLLVDKINDVINNTIPLWRSQTVIALGLAKQENALEMQRAISDATNELIRENARKLKQTTLGVKEESERSIIDIESLEEANKELIATIKGSLEISQQARQQRIYAEKKMKKIKDDLANALIEAIAEEKNQA